MKAGKRIKVHPLYGWGWSDSAGDATPFNVPESFEAVVASGSEVWFGKTMPTLRGTVHTDKHPLDGFTISMSPRHEPWDGDVNISLESGAGRRLDGFGSIDIASFG
ncbi:MAG: hypothetical protein J7494_06030 [Sphingobium sp.]|nr:hypothetical protein [Sphingobium sp.]